MGMDGMFRPSQMGYTSPAAQRSSLDHIRAANNQQPGVDPAHEAEAVTAKPHLNDEEPGGNKRQQHAPKDNTGDTMAEDLQEALTAAFGYQFDPAIHYEFWYNRATDRFELRDLDSGSVFLAINHDQFTGVLNRMNANSAGHIADRSA